MKKLQEATKFDYLKLLFLASIWSLSFICIEIALKQYSFIFIAFSRILLAFLFFLPFLYFKNLSFPTSFRVWKILFFAAILNNVLPFSLISWAQQYINASTASIVLAMGPFIALVLSHFITNDEKFTFFKFLGVSFGFFGIVLLFYNDYVNNIEGLYGQVAVLFACSGYILSGLLLRKVPEISSIVASTTMFFCASCILLPFILFLVPSSTYTYTYFNSSFYALIFLAIIPTAFASILRIKILQSVGVQFMSQVTYLIPLFTIFWAWIFFDEKPKILVYISLFFIFLGLFIRKIRK